VDIFVMNVDGTDRKRLTNMTVEHLGARGPAWSPDGSKIVFASNVQPRDIYVINADGTGTPKNLTNHPKNDGAPAWSADGRIAFVSNRDGGPAIWVMNADGTNPIRVTDAPQGQSSNHGADPGPAWSPNRRQIAYTSGRDGTRSIYVINADGTGGVRLTVSPTEDAHPSWSPDGRQIAFQRRVFGHNQIFVMKADGTEQRRLTDLSSVAANGFPDWGRAATKPPAR
jgi:TolB protein